MKYKFLFLMGIIGIIGSIYLIVNCTGNAGHNNIIDTFVCTQNDGSEKCVGQEVSTPDSLSDWVCNDADNKIVCTGNHMPSDVVDWVCEEDSGEIVTCTKDAYYPDNNEWNCYYERGVRICESGDGGDADSDGDTDSDADSDTDSDTDSDADGDTDSDADGDTDSDADGDGDCDESNCNTYCTNNGFDLGYCNVTTCTCQTGGDADADGDSDADGDTDSDADGDCTPSVQRYCGQVQCNWGIQTCDINGTWSDCTETTRPSECTTNKPYYEVCCYNAGYCCEDVYDLDNDGDYTDSVGNCN